jgi:hypothetical protein
MNLKQGGDLVSIDGSHDGVRTRASPKLITTPKRIELALRLAQITSGKDEDCHKGLQVAMMDPRWREALLHLTSPMPPFGCRVCPHALLVPLFAVPCVGSPQSGGDSLGRRRRRRKEGNLKIDWLGSNAFALPCSAGWGAHLSFQRLHCTAFFTTHRHCAAQE